MARIKRDPKTVALAQEIAKQFDPQSAEDADEALKELFGPIFESLLQGEMSHHLGYENNNKEYKQTQNRRNGYGQKTVHTTKGDITIDTPRDRDGSFEPQLISKRQRDVSGIEDKVLAMYARGMSQRDISKTIEDIYGFSISHEMVSDITDAILPELEEWRNRPLKKCYAFLFVDCMYVTLRSGYEAKECAVYTILGYDLNGHKDILGLWLSESESKNYWMQIFDELKARGIEDVFFMSMDGVSGLEEGAKAIFPKIIVQRCIVHLIRNSIKYVPSKDYKKFTQELKKVYGAPNLKAAAAAFESFCRTWEQYPGAIEVWKRNFKFVEQLYDYGSDVRRIMYTTNAIESINSSFRKVTKKGAFPNENALFKLLYLRCTELENKWNNGTIRDWSKVLNQLMVNEIFTSRIEKYLK
ncbi:IS256 family transposase [Erysipelotrichaceae bacterium AM07-12]|nr:IS256 family transposase [Longicatena caecimuris]RGD43373.1 IS256 family transposase [Erysipelotrichaceae bacterium AM07-12]RGD45983.1 IS256 family transposase [Erysipelotrichaceae bacterium AM07-35-1]